MKNKPIYIIGAILIIAGVYVYMTRTTPQLGIVPTNEAIDVAPTTTISSDRRMGTSSVKQKPTQTPERFSGTLTAINTGCFSDGECFAIVDEKHVTILWGWTEETVGKIEGVPSIGDLETQVGKTVSVYANKTAEGTYALYGDANYFIKI